MIGYLEYSSAPFFFFFFFFFTLHQYIPYHQYPAQRKRDGFYEAVLRDALPYPQTAPIFLTYLLIDLSMNREYSVHF
jgi:hypothetical protein